MRPTKSVSRQQLDVQVKASQPQEEEKVRKAAAADVAGGTARLDVSSSELIDTADDKWKIFHIGKF